MFETPISKNSGKVLHLLYKAYLDRRKNGISKESACYFGNADELQKKMFSDSLLEDVVSYCFELARIGFLFIPPGDDTATDIVLTDEAITYMENKPKKLFSDIVDTVSKLKR